MKRLITSVVVVVALSGLVSVQAQAQVTRDKQHPSGLGDLTTPVKSGTAATSVPLPKGDFTKLFKRLVITRFGADRSYPVNRDIVVIVGVISNTSLLATDVTYSVSTWRGAERWKELKAGSVKSLKPKDTTAVRMTFLSPVNPRPVRLKLEVRGPGEQTSQEFILK